MKTKTKRNERKRTRTVCAPPLLEQLHDLLLPRQLRGGIGAGTGAAAAPCGFHARVPAQKELEQRCPYELRRTLRFARDNVAEEEAQVAVLLREAANEVLGVRAQQLASRARAAIVRGAQHDEEARRFARQRAHEVLTEQLHELLGEHEAFSLVRAKASDVVERRLGPRTKEGKVKMRKKEKEKEEGQTEIDWPSP